MRAMPSEGDKAPDFELQNQDGETVRLADYAGRHVVLYFYPRADTPGCTTQACGIRDRGREYDAANAVVLGVSPDKPEALRKFADKYGLPFTLLADPDHQVAEAYGVWVEKSMYGKKYWGNERSTFLIGPDGKITKVLRKVKPAQHDDLVLEALAA
jgi:thioredoxin-dependent peroxiredoxin